MLLAFVARLWENETLRTCALVVVPSLVAYKLYKRYERAQRRKAYPRDIVVLHQYPAGQNAPSLSPWALKLETWLRMANIAYENEFAYEYGPKGKIPWITLNGQDLGDSQFCIEFLAKKFNIDFAKEHSASENGIARAYMKMVEESLAWAYMLDTFIFYPSPQDLGVPAVLLWLVRGLIFKRTKLHGYGLHSKSEVFSIGKSDLDAINELIGTKKYLLGDKVCDADASLFGVLSELRAHSRGPLHQYLITTCPNILRYLNGIRDAFWPDWNDRIKNRDY